MSIVFFFTILAITLFFIFFFFNDTATTEIYTLSLHDALPISSGSILIWPRNHGNASNTYSCMKWPTCWRSEEHTSELQSRLHLVCRLLLEKKKTYTHSNAKAKPKDNAAHFAILHVCPPVKTYV